MRAWCKALSVTIYNQEFGKDDYSKDVIPPNPNSLAEFSGDFLTTCNYFPEATIAI